MSIELISSLISEPQMLHNSRRIIGASVVSLFNKNNQSVLKTEQDFKEELKFNATSLSSNPTESKRVVIIPVVGVIRANGYGSTSQISDLLDEYEQDPTIAGYLFYHNTPGGSASGTGILAHKIYNLSKPSASYIHGDCCSAGEYLAASTNRRFVNKRADHMGSIGTMVSGLDMIPLFEKFGAKYFEVYAEGSEDKNKSWRDLVKGEESLIKEEITSYRNEFVEDMKLFQPNLPEEVFSGKIYRPKEAVAVGLADEIGTMQDALAWVISQSTQNQNSFNMSKKNFALIAGVLGVNEVFASSAIPGLTAKTCSFSEEQLEKIDSALANQSLDQSNQVTSLTEQVTALTNQVSQLQASLSTAEASVVNMETAINSAMEKAGVTSVEGGTEANFNALVNELGGRAASNPVNVHSPEETSLNTESVDYFPGINLNRL